MDEPSPESAVRKTESQLRKKIQGTTKVKIDLAARLAGDGEASKMLASLIKPALPTSALAQQSSGKGIQALQNPSIAITHRQTSKYPPVS